MIGAGEAALADLAAEGFSARVFPVVTGELVRSGETPLTLGPMAAVRFLTCRNDNTTKPHRPKKKENRREKVIICRIKMGTKTKNMTSSSSCLYSTHRFFI
jgi:hypothetical protein